MKNIINDINFENEEHVNIYIRESLSEDAGYKEGIGCAKAFIMDTVNMAGEPVKMYCFKVLDGQGLVPDELIITTGQINYPIFHLKDNVTIPYVPLPINISCISIHMVSLSMGDLIYHWNNLFTNIEKEYAMMRELYHKKNNVNLLKKEEKK